MLTSYQGCSRSGSGGLGVHWGVPQNLENFAQRVSELQFLTKFCNKRKGADHEIDIAFCLPIRG